MLQTSIQRSRITLSRISRKSSTTLSSEEFKKKKKQTHVKNRIVAGSNYQSYDTMPGDSTSYSIDNSFAMDNLPAEDVYKPKTVEKKSKKGLENFMEDDIEDVAVLGVER